MAQYQLKLFILALTCVSALAKDCSVRIRGSMTAPTPLILGSGTDQFVTPNNYADVVVKSGESIDLWCSDSFTSYNTKLLTATCESGVNFKVQGTTTTFKNFVCKSWPASTAENTGKNCEGGGSIVRVGFKISSTRFVEQYTVCFNTVTETALYSKYTLGPYSKYFQSGVDRTEFVQGNFFGNKNVMNLYTKKRQIQTIGSVLNTNANKYFNWNENLYLSRGHLAAKADFVYGAQQRATFLYINVAPQWQSFNGGNWNDIEITARDFANYYGLNLISYTGTYGVSTLPDNRGVETPIYLSQGSRNNQIPVPKLYYRILIDEASGKGVALVTVNDPYKSLSELKKDYILCNDVSNDITFFNGWQEQLKDLKRGYTYACTVPDLVKQVKTLPNLRVTGLLA